MYVTLNSNIKIGQYRFSGVHNIIIEKSIHEYADRAHIYLPTSSVVKQQGATTESVQTAKRFKVGDFVHIQLGYNGKLKSEFKGFVKQIHPNTPCEIECEGYSWLLRNKRNIKVSWKKTTLKNILQKVVEGTDIQLHDAIPSITLDNIAINDASGTQVLQYLKDLLKGVLAIYFIDDVLYAGLSYIDTVSHSVKYQLGYNTKESSSLKYKRAEDTDVQVEIIFKKPDGTAQTTKAGKAGGVIRKENISAVSDLDTLKDIAQARLLQENYDGYEGKINTLLQPYCAPAWRAELVNKRYPERNGNFFTESVKTTFGTDGAQRDIELGIKLST